MAMRLPELKMNLKKVGAFQELASWYSFWVAAKVTNI
jgi:hypothetical protein